MLWPDEVREPDFAFLDQQAPQTWPQDQEMADMLVESLSAETFDPAEYRDAYREALESLIDAKLAKRALPTLPEAEQILDLTEALRESIAHAKQRRG